MIIHLILNQRRPILFRASSTSSFLQKQTCPSPPITPSDGFARGFISTVANAELFHHLQREQRARYGLLCY